MEKDDRDTILLLLLVLGSMGLILVLAVVIP